MPGRVFGLRDDQGSGHRIGAQTNAVEGLPVMYVCNAWTTSGVSRLSTIRAWCCACRACPRTCCHQQRSGFDWTGPRAGAPFPEQQ